MNSAKNRSSEDKEITLPIQINGKLNGENYILMKFWIYSMIEKEKINVQNIINLFIFFIFVQKRLT